MVHLGQDLVSDWPVLYSSYKGEINEQIKKLQALCWWIACS